MSREAGKGDKRRPQLVSDEQVKSNWSNIFKQKKLKKK